MVDKLSKYEVHDLAVRSDIFVNYLETLGLPTDNIIASTEERGIVASSIPGFMKSLPDEVKKDGRYLSKFVGASVIGLFDAALNYIWNEVVLALRHKAIVYDIELFYDAAIGGNQRSLYKDEDDLPNLKDAQLIDTCLKLELLSPITYKKIRHILDMRNEVAASHPNVEAIGGFELMGWLDTCIKEVLKDSRSESAIRVKTFTANLKSYNAAIDDVTIQSLLGEIKHLASPHIHNLVFTLFNWYISTDDNFLRINISKLIPEIWNGATDSVKYKIGERVHLYRTQLRAEKDKAEEFLNIVKGRRYESASAKIFILNNLSDRLYEVHCEMNNFHKEPIVMREILQFCICASDIPDAISEKLIHKIIICRLGRGYVRYSEGIGLQAKNLYDKFFAMLDDKYISVAMQRFWASDIISVLDRDQTQKHAKSILSIFYQNAISDRLKEVISYMAEKIDKIDRIACSPQFQELTSMIWDADWFKKSAISY